MKRKTRTRPKGKSLRAGILYFRDGREASPDGFFRARSGKRKSGRKREDGFRLRTDGGRAKKERKGKELADEEIYEENELFKRKKKRRLA